MARYYSVVTLLLVLVCGVAGATTINIGSSTGWLGPSHPNYVGYLDSLNTWWHDGGAPTGLIPNDSIDIFPDKNHEVATFTVTVASTSLVDSYARKLSASDLYGWTTGGAPSYAETYGQFELGEYQDLTGAPDFYFPPETVGQPIYFYGDVPTGIRFKDVKDEMLVQFFSSDKNDGFVEVLVDNVLINRYDTWCQGWWYLQVQGMDPNAGPHTVEIRTWYNYAQGHGYASPHINTLDLNPTSENWLHKLPGDPGYPIPDDFHVFFVAYNPMSEIPEPATMSLVALGGLATLWMRRKRSR